MRLYREVKRIQEIRDRQQVLVAAVPPFPNIGACIATGSSSIHLCHNVSHNVVENAARASRRQRACPRAIGPRTAARVPRSSVPAKQRLSEVHQEFAVITWNGESSRLSPPSASPKTETPRGGRPKAPPGLALEPRPKLREHQYLRGRLEGTTASDVQRSLEYAAHGCRVWSRRRLQLYKRLREHDTLKCPSHRPSTATPQPSSSQGLEHYGTPLPNRCRGPPMGSAQVLRGRGSGQGSERVFRGSTPRPVPNGCHKDGEGFWIHGLALDTRLSTPRQCFRDAP
ncbi:uncharacterized protein LOC142574883 [Dermacentor variabilis]|uniref:uncharacterized protein LOC142574883 n=1 Tax=Dermacentor variabilis TaxID=34621 RepID=UPI003F5C90B6